MKKFTLSILSFLLAASMAWAQADSVNVTFMVDMSGETVAGTGVWLWAYNEDDWENDSYWEQMSDGDVDDVYDFTLKLPTGMKLWFNYFNGSGDEDYENVTEGCRYDAEWNDRYYLIPDADVTLTTVPYGGCAAAGTDSVMVTFQVDMSGEDTIATAGVWLWVNNEDDWDNDTYWVEMTEGNTDSLFSYTLKLPAGMKAWYNYYNGQDVGESVGEECRYDLGWNERYIKVLPVDMNIPAVPFGGCLEPAQTVSVTFRVDMTKETVSGDGVRVVIKDPWYPVPMQLWYRISPGKTYHGSGNRYHPGTDRIWGLPVQHSTQGRCYVQN